MKLPGEEGGWENGALGHLKPFRYLGQEKETMVSMEGYIL